MVLHLTQRALAFVGFFAGKQIFRYKCLHTLVSLLILINLLTFVSTSVVYIVIHLQMGDIENVLQACYQVTGTVPLLASFFTIMYHKEKVAKLIDAFQKIFNRCAGKSSAIGFMRADRLSEIFITVAMSAILGGFIASSIASVAIDAIIDFTRDGYIEAKDLFLPFKMSIPLNRNSYDGWIYDFCLHMIFGSSYVLVNVTTVTFVVAIGLYIEAYTLHFRTIFTDQVDYARSDMKSQIKKSLIDAVNFHNKIKRIFELAQDILSGTIFFQLLMGVIFISITIFDMEMAMKHLDLNFFVLCIGANTSIGTIFLYCFVGSLTTEQSLRFVDISYESQWYKLSMDQQKIIHILMVNAQRPLIFSGFQIIELNLITFIKIMKTVVTYYFIFKSITN